MAENLLLKVLCLEIPSNFLKYDFHTIKKELKSIKEKFAQNQHRRKLRLNATTSLQFLSLY